MAPSAFSPEYLQQDKGPLLVRIIWVFEALALTAVCLKVWTRVKVLHQSGLEDVFVLLSDVSCDLAHVPLKRSITDSRGQVLSLVYGALLTVSVHYGLGRHAAAIVPTARKAIKLYVAAIPFGMLSVTLPTLAIAIILHQTTDPSPQQLRFLYGIPMLNLVIRIVNVILVFTSCLPDKPQALHGVSKCVNYVVAIHYMYFATCKLQPVSNHPNGCSSLWRHCRFFRCHGCLPDRMADSGLLEAAACDKEESHLASPLQHDGRVSRRAFPPHRSRQ